MNKRLYKIELILEDTFEDSELEDSEMSIEEIAEHLSKDLPFGFKVVKETVTKIESVD